MIWTDFLGEKVSTLGMGNMRLPTIGSDPWGKVNYEKAQEMIDFCFSNGVNYFDTAYVYHQGDSEKFLGEALKKYNRKDYKLATKFLVTANADYKKVFAEQLDRLKTSYIDFYLIHSIQDNNADLYFNKFGDYEENSIEYFLDEQKKGRIKHLGFSFHGSLDLLKRFLSHHKWDFAQIQFNYLDYYFGEAKAQYDILSSQNIPLIIMEPVRGGTLAKLNDALVKKIKDEHENWSAASFALRFVRQFDCVKVVLSGMSDLNQVKDNIKTFSDATPFSKADNDFAKEIATAYKSTISVPCTACRYCCDTCPSCLDIPNLISLYNEHEYSLDFLKPSIKEKWHNMPIEKQPVSCVACGSCMEHCPQHIDIPQVMKKIVALG